MEYLEWKENYRQERINKNEIWKDVKDYEGLYQISSLGRIKSFVKWRGKNERILNPIIGKSGYYHVTLCKNKIKKQKRINQLVGIAFLNHIPCNNGMEVDHIDNIKLNNRLDNLQLLTRRENNAKMQLAKEKNSSKYIGVCWFKKKNKWRADIVVNGKQKYLGLFINEIDAHNAYQKELLSLNI